MASLTAKVEQAMKRNDDYHKHNRREKDEVLADRLVTMAGFRTGPVWRILRGRGTYIGMQEIRSGTITKEHTQRVREMLRSELLVEVEGT